MKCNCANGFYFSSVTLECSLCTANCIKCSGPLTNDCQTCLGELTPSAKGCTCASGIMLNGNCVACHPSCQTCSGQTENDCLTCKAGFKQVGRTCSCLSGYFNIATATCDTCARGCNTCLDAGSMSCLTCLASVTFSGTATGTCVCEDEDAGCCDKTCDEKGRLPLCKKCLNSGSTDPWPLTDSEKALLALIVICPAIIIALIVAVICICRHHYKKKKEWQRGAQLELEIKEPTS